MSLQIRHSLFKEELFLSKPVFRAFGEVISGMSPDNNIWNYTGKSKVVLSGVQELIKLGVLTHISKSTYKVNEADIKYVYDGFGGIHITG